MQSNLASKREYNFEQFQAPAAAPSIERVPKREQLPHPGKILSMALVILAVVFAALYGRVQIAQLNNQINEATTRLEELTSEKVRMEAELDGQMSLSTVEEIATEELGMVKPDNSQVTYLKVQQQNVIQTPEKSQSLLDIIADFLEGLGFDF
jgi:cell division protein FtsL